MGSARLVHVSEADYLSGEELPGTRHEYVAGQIFVMAGATKTHGTIALNIGVYSAPCCAPRLPRLGG